MRSSVSQEQDVRCMRSYSAQRPDNFERAVLGIIRFRGAHGDRARRGDVERIKSLSGPAVARTQWTSYVLSMGLHQAPVPRVSWWC